MYKLNVYISYKLILVLKYIILFGIKKTHKEGEQLEDRRSAGEISCTSGDGTDQRVQSLIFMMMMINKNCHSSRQTPLSYLSLY